MRFSKHSRFGRAEVVWVSGLAAGVVGLGVAAAIAVPPTTINDFFGPGTQPGELTVEILHPDECIGCHAYYDPQHEPGELWMASMMGQAMRDPMFIACLAVAEQDAPFVGDFCIRCHTPGGWYAGRSTPTDGSGLDPQLGDFHGVSCNFCHRQVDPEYKPGISPPEDQAILAGLMVPPPPNPGNNYSVIDPDDLRRGPYDLTGGFVPHDWRQSPFHKDSALCASCHDVSNPALDANPDGTYTFNNFDEPHATFDKYDMFPVERTYSEWLMSDFAVAPIDMTGRFGGVEPFVSTCQDCHMPAAVAQGCVFADPRSDLPTHQFNGGNTWVLNAIRDLYPDFETGLNDQNVAGSVARTVGMLENASDLELYEAGPVLTTRIINFTGHKLPTGYPEGRRMWVNVKFRNSGNAVIAERGFYDFGTADLTTSDTKVYEAKAGLDNYAATILGLPEGPSFHFAVSNKWFKDNRIPPMGFTNANFEAVDAKPVAHTYADGQYWDDTNYAVPPGAVEAEVTVYYQTTSKEYVTFLRDENVDSVGDPMNPSEGEIAYDQWVAQGMSAPTVMDNATISVCAADMNNDGNVNGIDVGAFLQSYGTGNPAADMNLDGVLNGIDVGLFLQAYALGC